MKGVPLLREFMRQHRTSIRAPNVHSEMCGKKSLRLQPAKIGEDSIPAEERIAAQLASCRQVIKREREKRSSSSTSSVLMDSYGRFHNYLRVSLTERCNLRCTYCMPSEGIKLTHDDELLSTEEIVRLLKLFAKAGINRVRFTGGEPLLHKDLLEIVRKTKELGINHIGITTNAITLSRHLEDLALAGLSHINISLDTLDGNSFKRITRRNGLNIVRKGIQAALDAGYAGEGRLKINCVVMRDVNHHTMAHLLDLAREDPIDVRFIEWMPFNGNKWTYSRFVGYREILKCLENEQLEAIQNACHNDTTKWYKVSVKSRPLPFCVCVYIMLTPPILIGTALDGTSRFYYEYE